MASGSGAIVAENVVLMVNEVLTAPTFGRKAHVAGRENTSANSCVVKRLSLRPAGRAQAFRGNQIVSKPFVLDRGIADRASRSKSPQKNRASLKRTKRKEAAGSTYQQEREGRSSAGAGHDISSLARMGAGPAKSPRRKALTSHRRRLPGHQVHAGGAGWGAKPRPSSRITT